MLTSSDFSWSAALLRARRPVNAMLQTRLVSAMCTPRDMDDYLALLDATWSLREVRARVLAVHPEADGATSLHLRPNEHWRGFRAGQFVCMSARIDGTCHTRCFSLSSAPEDGVPLRITLKELPGGRAGSWAAHAARPGDVVALSQARGDFTLPAPVPPKLLFISGGSGITPIVSMVRHVLAGGLGGDLVSLHYARRESTLGDEMTALACRHPRFRFIPVLTRGRPAASPLLHGHFSIEHLEAVAPFWNDCEIFVCGPPSLRTAVAQLVQERGLGHRLHVERFAGDVLLPTAATPLHCRLTFAKSGCTIDGHAAASLLVQAEAAGLRPAHGCRMGVCHSCKCKKLSGVVRNELTGLLSTEPEEDIQLCVNTPQSDVILEL